MKKHLTFLQLIDEAIEGEQYAAEIEKRKIKQLSFDDLDEVQREMLTAALIREAGKMSYEYITESSLIDDAINQILNLAENHFDYLEREKSLKRLGKYFLQGACEHARKQIDSALKNAYNNSCITFNSFNNRVA